MNPGWRCHICGQTGPGTTTQWQRHYNQNHLEKGR